MEWEIEVVLFHQIIYTDYLSGKQGLGELSFSLSVEMP